MNSQEGNINVFPNPVSDNLNISVFLPKPDHLKIRILNITGELIYSGEADYEGGQKVLNINTTSLASGMYFVHVNYNNGQSLTSRFVK